MRGSEPLREDQGEDEKAQQGDGRDQADDVLGGHSFVTPLATRATSANTAIVVTTKARSAIVSSWRGSGSNGSDQPRKPASRPDSVRLNGPYTATRPLLTQPIRPPHHPAVTQAVKDP
ncbi:hypothetical protein SGM_6650 [Streptomyces griseoaurantiacus M045]|uniref:Uncharacterized protein n=1 Tax=Streptomyces griseoaurantiacus M045 TaxID=996637 RepID=F3NBW1_9ACTN|nr:hypothetical protein SGM_6650 [Streptomyces griseoaurantiacus M045]